MRAQNWAHVTNINTGYIKDIDIGPKLDSSIFFNSLSMPFIQFLKSLV